MKKTLAIILAAVMCVALFAGCGSTPAAETSAPASAPAAPAADEGSGKKVTLTMQNIWCGADSKTAEWTRIVSEFNAEYEGRFEVKLEDQADYDAYADKLKTLVSSGDTPDLFTCKQGYIDLYASSGQLLNISQIIQDNGVADRIPADTMSAAVYDDGNIYVLPYETAIIPLFYNEKLLKAAGVESIPASYDELYDTCVKLRDSGVYPITQTTGNQAWFAQLMNSYCLASVMGADMYNNAYDSAGWIEGMELYRTLFEHSEDDIIGAGTSEANGHFFNERSAIYCNGTWILGRFVSEGVEGLTDNLQIGGSLAYNGNNAGGYMSVVQAYIGAAKTDDPDKLAAISAFYEFITRPEQVLPLCKSSGSLFAPEIDTSALEEGMQTRIIAAGAQASFLFDHIQNVLKTQVYAEYNANIDSFLLGELSAEEFCGILATADAEA